MIKTYFKDYPSGQWMDWSPYFLGMSKLNLRIESDKKGEAGAIVFDEVNISYLFQPIINGQTNPVNVAFSAENMAQKKRYLIRIAEKTAIAEYLLLEGVASFENISYPLQRNAAGTDYDTTIVFKVKDKLSALSTVYTDLTRRSEIDYINEIEKTYRSIEMAGLAIVLFDTNRIRIDRYYDKAAWVGQYITLQSMFAGWMKIQDVTYDENFHTIFHMDRTFDPDALIPERGKWYWRTIAPSNYPAESVTCSVWTYQEFVSKKQTGTLALENAYNRITVTGYAGAFAKGDQITLETKDKFTDIKWMTVNSATKNNSGQWVLTVDDIPDSAGSSTSDWWKKMQNDEVSIDIYNAIKYSSSISTGYFPSTLIRQSSCPIIKGSILAYDWELQKNDQEFGDSKTLAERPLFLVLKSWVTTDSNGNRGWAVKFLSNGKELHSSQNEYLYKDASGKVIKKRYSFDHSTVPAFDSSYLGNDICVYEDDDPVNGELIAFDLYKILENLVHKVWSDMTIRQYDENGNLLPAGSKILIPLHYFPKLIEIDPLGKQPLEFVKFVANSTNSYVYIDKDNKFNIRKRKGLTVGATPKQLNYSKLLDGSEKEPFWDKLVDGVEITVNSWIKDTSDGKGETYLQGFASITKQQGIEARNPLQKEVFAIYSTFQALKAEHPEMTDQQLLDLYAAELATEYMNFYGLRHEVLNMSFSLYDEALQYSYLDTFIDHDMLYFPTNISFDLINKQFTMKLVSATAYDYDLASVTVQKQAASGSSSSGSSSGGSSYGIQLVTGSDTNTFTVGKNAVSESDIIEILFGKGKYKIKSQGQGIEITKLIASDVVNSGVILQNLRGMNGDVLFSTTGKVKLIK